MTKKIFSLCLMLSVASLSAMDESSAEKVMTNYFQLLSRYALLQKQYAENGFDDALAAELKECEQSIVLCEQEIELLQKSVDSVLVSNDQQAIEENCADQLTSSELDAPDYFSNMDLLDDSNIIAAKPSWLKIQLQAFALWCAQVAVHMEDGYAVMKKRLALMMTMIRRELGLSAKKNRQPLAKA